MMLRDPFDVVHSREGKFDYVTWSQVADRLDEVAPGWSFEVRQLGEDYCWGRLTIAGQIFENVGYGENASADWKKEVLKDAVSDAFKRCAALAGVARYLYDKDAPQRPNVQRPVSEPTPIRPVAQRSSTALPDEGDLDFDSLPTTKPTNGGGQMWTKDLMGRAERKGLTIQDVGNASKKMFGKDAWKLTALTDEQRYDLAVELDLL